MGRVVNIDVILSKKHSRLDHIENLMVGKSFIVVIDHDDNHKLES